MAQVVEYQIKGTSDVPQQTEKAKKAMSELDKQTAAIGKKFTEIGKDLFLGFLAPMVLIREAIGFISQSIEKARQDAKDAVDFAAGVKFEDLNKSPVEQTTRYMAQKLQVDIRTEEEQKKAELAKRVSSRSSSSATPVARSTSARTSASTPRRAASPCRRRSFPASVASKRTSSRSCRRT